jgi:hypothetical protein
MSASSFWKCGELPRMSKKLFAAVPPVFPGMAPPSKQKRQRLEAGGCLQKATGRRCCAGQNRLPQERHWCNWNHYIFHFRLRSSKKMRLELQVAVAWAACGNGAGFAGVRGEPNLARKPLVAPVAHTGWKIVLLRSLFGARGRGRKKTLAQGLQETTKV